MSRSLGLAELLVLWGMWVSAAACPYCLPPGPYSLDESRLWCQVDQVDPFLAVPAGRVPHCQSLSFLKGPENDTLSSGHIEGMTAIVWVQHPVWHVVEGRAASCTVNPLGLQLGLPLTGVVPT